MFIVVWKGDYDSYAEEYTMEIDTFDTEREAIDFVERKGRGVTDSLQAWHEKRNLAIVIRGEIASVTLSYGGKTHEQQEV